MKRILIIEDDQISQQLLRLHLQGFNVDVAENLSEAELFVREHDYHCIILDVNLRKSQESGLTVLNWRIRPIIIITAVNDIKVPDDAVKVYRKPFNYRNLTSIVKEICQIYGKKKTANGAGQESS